MMKFKFTTLKKAVLVALSGALVFGMTSCKDAIEVNETKKMETPKNLTATAFYGANLLTWDRVECDNMLLEVTDPDGMVSYVKISSASTTTSYVHEVSKAGEYSYALASRPASSSNARTVIFEPSGFTKPVKVTALIGTAGQTAADVLGTVNVTKQPEITMVEIPYTANSSNLGHKAPVEIEFKARPDFQYKVLSASLHRYTGNGGRLVSNELKAGDNISSLSVTSNITTYTTVKQPSVTDKLDNGLITVNANTTMEVQSNPHLVFVYAVPKYSGANLKSSLIQISSISATETAGKPTITNYRVNGYDSFDTDSNSIARCRPVALDDDGKKNDFAIYLTKGNPNDSLAVSIAPYLAMTYEPVTISEMVVDSSSNKYYTGTKKDLANGSYVIKVVESATGKASVVNYLYMNIGSGNLIPSSRANLIAAPSSLNIDTSDNTKKTGTVYLNVTEDGDYYLPTNTYKVYKATYVDEYASFVSVGNVSLIQGGEDGDYVGEISDTVNAEGIYVYKLEAIAADGKIMSTIYVSVRVSDLNSSNAMSLSVDSDMADPTFTLAVGSKGSYNVYRCEVSNASVIPGSGNLSSSDYMLSNYVKVGTIAVAETDKVPSTTYYNASKKGVVTPAGDATKHYAYFAASADGKMMSNVTSH